MNGTKIANAVRALSMDAVQKAGSGHPGAPMGMADMPKSYGRYFTPQPRKPRLAESRPLRAVQWPWFHVALFPASL